VPAVPSCILQPLWNQLQALVPARRVRHPLGCHRPRVPDRVIFDKLIQVLVFGCGYRRIADASCSATTLRRRRDEWIALGLAEQLHQLALAAYDRLHGLEPEHLAIDGCITKLVIALAGLWLLSPIDLVPEFLPVIGPLDDVGVVALALRYAARQVPRDVLIAAWPGAARLLERLLGGPAQATG
jgi:transposase